MARRSKALGRGLGALIDDQEYDNKNPQTQGVNEVDVFQIQTNPYQPRTQFDEESIRELSASIKQLGIIQPLTLRKLDNGIYQLIAGERRLRAAKSAGLDKVPAYIRDVNDQEMLELALVENIQRQDLNAIEIAISYDRLITECSLTQQVMSQRVGKSRSTIANYLRLLKLPDKIQIALRDSIISMGHARSLISIDESSEQLSIFAQIISDSLSVRNTEELVRNLNTKNDQQSDQAKPELNLPDRHQSVALRMQTHLHADIKLNRAKDGKGKIVIPFKSDADFDRIIELLRLSGE